MVYLSSGTLSMRGKMLSASLADDGNGGAHSWANLFCTKLWRCCVLSLFWPLRLRACKRGAPEGCSCEPS